MKVRFRFQLIIVMLLFFALASACKPTNSNNKASSNQNSNTTSGAGSSSSSTSNGSSTSSSQPATAAPANLPGKYSVVGTNPNGGGYRGTLEVIAHADVYQFHWNAGNQYDGVGVLNGSFVAVSFANGSDGKGCGVIDYVINADGSLNGKWGHWGTDGSGTETATRTSGSGLEGQYDGSGKNPNGQRYQVKLTVEPAGNLYHFTWSNNTDGVGVRRGSNVAVGIGGSRCGFVMYEVQRDGMLDGVWGGGGSDKTGTEKATKQ